MPTFPMITPSERSEQVIDTFGGYNHNLKINDGEFYDTRNLTTDYYPLLGNRKPIHNLPIAGDLEKYFSEVYGLTTDTDGSLYVVGDMGDGVRLYCTVWAPGYSGAWTDMTEKAMKDYTPPKYETVAEHKTAELTATNKQMVIFNNQLVIYPDKKIFDTYPPGAESGISFRSMDVSLNISFHGGAVWLPYRNDNPDDVIMDLPQENIGSSAPDPAKSNYWAPGASFYISNGTSWVLSPSVKPMLILVEDKDWHAFDGISVGDTVTITGNSNINGTYTVIAPPKAGTDKTLIKYAISLAAQTFKKEIDSIDATITDERKTPSLQYVVSASNRLWGCVSLGTNEIHASALGDPVNWATFQGLSTDSYAASCGTPGDFTGAAVINGNPIFFKENYYHKVYISPSGAHQIISKEVDGVEKGSSNSVTVWDNVCYYKSRAGIKAFDGTQTYDIGAALGEDKYYNAMGGIAEGKYYICMQTRAGFQHLFVYDIKRRIWMRQDNTDAKCFKSISGLTFFAENIGDNHIPQYKLRVIGDESLINFKDDIQSEKEMQWEAVTGLQGYNYTGRKYITRFNLRMILPKGSTMEVYIEYDSSGKWEKQGEIDGTGTNTFMLPVKPRRCDHFRIKLKGTGTVRIYSFSKIFEGGSDNK